jgi:hypothetical protein
MSQETQTNVTYKLVRDPETGFENITVFVKGKGQFPARSDHPNFENIVTAARTGDESVIELFDLALTAGVKFEDLTERVSYSPGHLFLDGNEINNALSQQIVNMIQEKSEFEPFVNFLDKMSTNPEPLSVEDLYKFITANQDSETGAFTVTDEGNFIAYKGVASDGNGGYRSTFSGKAIVDGEVVEGYIPNAVGSVVTMPRSEVTFDPSRHCSTGLHVGTFDYAQSYGRGGAMLKVLVNPRDVVSVPSDTNEKMRVCRYKVLEIIDTPVAESVVAEPVEATAPEYDVRVGDVFEDTDKRRKGSRKKVVRVNLEDGTVTVESKGTLRRSKNSSIALSRLFSRKYKRVQRGRKS